MIAKHFSLEKFVELLIEGEIINDVKRFEPTSYIKSGNFNSPSLPRQIKIAHVVIIAKQFPKLVAMNS